MVSYWILTVRGVHNMKKIVTSMPQPTSIISLDNLKILDERPNTCDYIVSYVTHGGLIAKLVSHKPKGCNWVAGFTYIRPRDRNGSLSYQGYTHGEAIEKSIRSGKELMLFENEFEFLQFCIKDCRLMESLAKYS